MEVITSMSAFPGEQQAEPFWSHPKNKDKMQMIVQSAPKFYKIKVAMDMRCLEHGRTPTASEQMDKSQICNSLASLMVVTTTLFRDQLVPFALRTSR